ncbi:MAG TPA: aromatic ring-hydroxylating dioxygenase subunit alpha [Chloroflexota bacterium]|nr:aromatic ring-hydroxylating dioxygenase subunit alpha [Chloroflexota bacterium]
MLLVRYCGVAKVSQDVRSLANLEQGLLSAQVFVDPAVYELELERIFSRTWLYVAHDSEVPNPGDFVTRSMGEDSVIVVRGSDGLVRVLLNTCRHRGRRLCELDAGTQQHFRCPYHGWTYNNRGELTGVPYFDSYAGRLDKTERGLFGAAGVDTYKGLIFATWNASALPLSEYLGEMKWVLDLMFGRTDAVEVVGPPLRWTLDANWKLPAANFAGDGGHLATTHGFRDALMGRHVGPFERGARLSFSKTTANGHTASLTGLRDTPKPYLALPEELLPQLRSNLSRDQLEILKPLEILVGNVFPNLSFLNTAGHTPPEWGGPDGQSVSFLTIRQWQPLGPERIEVWSWLLVDKAASAQWQEYSRECYLRVFGPGGVFEQDDLANWRAVTQSLHGRMSRKLSLYYDMGLDVSPTEDWPGPGSAYAKLRGPVDVNERAFYARWLELMTQDQT